MKMKIFLCICMGALSILGCHKAPAPAPQVSYMKGIIKEVDSTGKYLKNSPLLLFNSTSVPEAEFVYTTNEPDGLEYLDIFGKDNKWGIEIYLTNLSYSENFKGTFNFKDSSQPLGLFRWSEIAYAPNGFPRTQDEYDNYTWRVGGIYIPHTSGSVTITVFDTVKTHSVRGTFSGTYYNHYSKTYKVVTEGKFFCPLKVVHNQ